MPFIINVSYTPGKLYLPADALSHQPLFHEMEQEHDAADGVYRMRRTYTHKESARDDLQLAPLFAAAAVPKYQEVIKFIREGGAVGTAKKHTLFLKGCNFVGRNFDIFFCYIFPHVLGLICHIGNLSSPSGSVFIGNRKQPVSSTKYK